MTVKIVTDSTADFSVEEANALGVTIVPLTVRFGDESFFDRVDITPEQFYGRLVTSPVFPQTSQPATGAFQEAYAGLAAAGATEILCITMSSRLSGTLNSARLAASEAPAGCRVYTLDSTTVAGGLGAMVERAANVGQHGGSAEDAAEAARLLIPRHRITILLDTLEYLQKGGRIGKARALLGGLLNIKPILEVKDREVSSVERVRNRTRGIERVFDKIIALPEVEQVIVQHTGAISDAESLATRLRTAFPGVDVGIKWIGPVVGAYVGPNGIGTVAIERVAGSG